MESKYVSTGTMTEATDIRIIRKFIKNFTLTRVFGLKKGSTKKEHIKKCSL